MPLDVHGSVAGAVPARTGHRDPVHRRPPLFLDFETRSAVDLRSAGVYRYAVDPTTSVIVACYAFGDGPIRSWFPGEPVPPEIIAHVEAGGRIVAHNAQFERVIWRHCLMRLGWPRWRLSQWICTAAMAAAMALPRRLEDAAHALQLGVSKDMEGHRLMLRMCRPRAFGENGAHVWWDDDARIQRLTAYCATDVEVERRIYARCEKLSLSELEIYRLDAVINDRGVQLDVATIKAAQPLVARALAALDRRMSMVTDGFVTTCNQVAKLTEWCEQRGVYTESLDKEHLAELLADELPAAVRAALLLRQEAAKSSTAKLRTMLGRVSADGRLRGNLLYHGASTGRFAGLGAQLHNLPRPVGMIGDATLAANIIQDNNIALIELLFGPTLSTVSDILRPLLIAAPGKELLFADYAAIELRVLAWLARQNDLVKALAEGAKIYEEMAAVIYGVLPAAIGKDSIERQLGKICILGCGYQMGGAKFTASAKKRGVIIAESLGIRAVFAFRERYPAIPTLWRGLNDAAMTAVANPGMTTACGPIRYRVAKGFLWCRLPSGRVLAYAAPKIEKKMAPWGEEIDNVTFLAVNSLTHQWERHKGYGGFWAENCVQAIARDLMCHGMLAVEDAGYPVVLTVHDEVISEVDAGFGSLDEFEKLLCSLPEWAKGCPIKADGYRRPRYQKAA